MLGASSAGRRDRRSVNLGDLAADERVLRSAREANIWGKVVQK
jgi:hypothetical protein